MKQARKHKLLKKTSKHYLTFGLAAVVLSLVALFFITQYVLKDETKDALMSIAYRVENHIKTKHRLINIEPIIYSEKVEFLAKQTFKDTLLFDPEEGEEELFTQLIDYRVINNNNYKITVFTRAVDSEDILLAILGSYAAIFLSFVLVQYYLNKKTNQKIWKPFFDNLKTIKSFSVQSNESINLVDTDIEEFYELNTELKTLTNKVITDYNNLKQFTEDISHEIQTPLAVIQAKIGNLIDENVITENQYNLLIDIQNNCRRLARLNKKLILLTKIENQQFKTSKKLNFTKVLTAAIEDFKELTTIPINFSKKSAIEIYLDQHLARVITDNLLSNAIKHTAATGLITIETHNNKLTISNSGEQAIQEPHKLFNRFFRETASNKSLGLGLAIIKKICDTHNYKVSYSFKNLQHTFTITFS